MGQRKGAFPIVLWALYEINQRAILDIYDSVTGREFVRPIPGHCSFR